MDIDKNKLGDAARRFRQRLDLTQADVAERAGMSANAYALIERGERACSIQAIEAIASAFGIPASFLTVMATPVRRDTDPDVAKAVASFQEVIDRLV